MTDSSREPVWPLWEVFVQEGEGEAHRHAGNVHAADGEMALQNARDVYARRGNIKSMWVVETKAIIATAPADAGPFFDPAQDKPYRHPTFYHAEKITDATAGAKGKARSGKE